LRQKLKEMEKNCDVCGGKENLKKNVQDVKK